jgi:hypothetical protein
VSPETIEGVAAFDEKRMPDYAMLRTARANDEAPEFYWGAPLQTCPACGANNLPVQFKFCGACGEPLSE